ncbi:hypothetical protein ACFOGG_18305 [Brenneria rubrifaciens]|uniref:hypothetical protein n=1 Tax=Brenneria rubrifaciens TaxID=55213 RepID=UPI00360CDBA1
MRSATNETINYHIAGNKPKPLAVYTDMTQEKQNENVLSVLLQKKKLPMTKERWRTEVKNYWHSGQNVT